MTLSREARILIGILILAIGAWVWVNFATRSKGASNSALTVAQAAEAPPTVRPSQPTVARDVQIAELPFLVTAPPEVTATLTDALTPAASGGPTLPSAKRVSVNPFSPIIVKTTTVSAPSSAPASQANTVQVVDVPIRQPSSAAPLSGTTDAATTRQPITAPAPLAQAPAATEVGSFPRALPSGTLPAVPDILTTTVVPSAIPSTPVQPAQKAAPSDLSTVAAISVPSAKPAPVSLAGATTSGGTATSVPAPLPLPSRQVATEKPKPSTPVQPAQKAAPSDLSTVAAISVPSAKPAPVSLAGATTSGGTATSVPAPLALETRTAPQSKPTPPLEAGVTPLSRYLRDHNFRFTGEVLGTVGVGVFRSSLGGAPLVLALGQKLPDTDIVLTNLKGQQAEFTQGDDKQVLILDLRR